MKNDFLDLVEKFGIPKILIPNQEIKLFQGKIIRKQIKCGESEFLVIDKRNETWLSDEQKLVEHLTQQNLQIIETIYFYKSDNSGGRYTAGDWKESKVAVTTNADVEPLSRENILQAIEETRVLFVGGWSSMGDGYVDFRICSPDNLPTFSGYYFLFDLPLIEEMLFGMGDGLEWEEEFFYPYSHYFSRFFDV